MALQAGSGLAVALKLSHMQMKLPINSTSLIMLIWKGACISAGHALPWKHLILQSKNVAF